MRKTIIVILMTLMASTCQAADERILLSFELTQNGKPVSSGTTIISTKMQSWSKGLKRSYIQLKCKKHGDKTVRSYSTVEHFHGLVITHQQQGDTVSLDLTNTTVVPSFSEISKLKPEECRDLKPTLTHFHSRLELPAENAAGKEKSLDEGYLFRYTLTTIDW